MIAHTPGPWSFEHVYGTCYTVQCAGKQYHIGTVRGKQNARLIAAAPELLALAKKIASLNPNAGEIGCGMLNIIVHDALCAIAKATGK